jgi:uncharacterized membrane protein
MTTFTILLYIIGVIISWFIFYYVTKAAVRNGIREARADKEAPTYVRESIPERPASAEQVKLQQRYDKGEITFEVYQSEWNKLSNR